jgi:hypothetical protein
VEEHLLNTSTADFIEGNHPVCHVARSYNGLKDAYGQKNLIVIQHPPPHNLMAIRSEAGLGRLSCMRFERDKSCKNWQPLKLAKQPFLKEISSV